MLQIDPEWAVGIDQTQRLDADVRGRGRRRGRYQRGRDPSVGASRRRTRPADIALSPCQFGGRSSPGLAVCRASRPVSPCARTSATELTGAITWRARRPSAGGAEEQHRLVGLFEHRGPDGRFQTLVGRQHAVLCDAGIADERLVGEVLADRLHGHRSDVGGRVATHPPADGVQLEVGCLSGRHQLHDRCAVGEDLEAERAGDDPSRQGARGRGGVQEDRLPALEGRVRGLGQPDLRRSVETFAEHGLAGPRLDQGLVVASVNVSVLL